ncbi:hypothetical protein ABT168_08810 [Streptomyces sp. NPDC001793]|uniref:hypothetical protein n=1 Tax=Streptomyces sp. NPDC001793 TaxID=3154657 RepID=UPI00331F84FF
MTTPHAPKPANSGRARPGLGGSKDAARRASFQSSDPHPTDDGSTLRPAPQAGAPGDPTLARPGIRIYAPPVYRHHQDGARWSKRLGDTPTAAYACRCGRISTATGLRSVAALVAEYDAHKTTCTGTPAALTEGRAAA